jgi:sarcosine oxidase, subunit beta
MKKNCYDVIVIGAGSVGVPTTLFLAKKGLKVLCIDKHSSPGQGQNKAAIGGVRATHSDPGKIKICQQTIDIFSNWEEEYGITVGWKKGGYCFPVYRSEEEEKLKSILPVQKAFHLNIDWVNADKIKEVVPGINPNNLIGGTYSPDDGQVSPLRATMAMEKAARAYGAVFLYRSMVIDFIKENNRVNAVRTEKDMFHCNAVVNAAGADAAAIAKKLDINIPILPDCHEAGVSAPVKEFLHPLVVDLRPGVHGMTSNFYFGQNHENALVFCYTPNPIKPGRNRASSSEFMPVIANQLVSLFPKLKNIRIRRLWRGLYPMTPDGVAIIGKTSKIDNLYFGAGMCGQGLMMGPGTGKNIASLIVDGKPEILEEVFADFSPERNFYSEKQESLK